MQPSLAESKFVEKIDCNFPYSNLDRCKGLISKALEISPNSVFAVVEELARIPVPERETVEEADLVDLLHSIDSQFEHPLKEKIFEAALLMIGQKELAVDKAIDLLGEVESHPGQWSALSIAYYSCDDAEGKVDARFDEISDHWKESATA